MYFRQISYAEPNRHNYESYLGHSPHLFSKEFSIQKAKCVERIMVDNTFFDLKIRFQKTLRNTIGNK